MAPAPIRDECVGGGSPFLDGRLIQFYNLQSAIRNLKSKIYLHSPSPHAFRLRLIFFLTIAQVFVVRKDSDQRFTIRWNISK